MSNYTDLSRIRHINPNLNIQQGDFPDLGPGGVENPILTDGEHIILECSNCRHKLVDIWVTSPSENIVSKVRAVCGYCGDKSFEKQVRGSFHLGGTEESLVLDTEYLDLKVEQGIVKSQNILVKTAKGKKDE